MKEYSLLVGLGASLAILRVVQHVPRGQTTRWANAGLLTLLGCLVGARLFYVGAHWGYFSSHIFESIVLWSGGLSWFGAIIGGYLSIFILSLRWRISPRKLADGLSPMIPPLMIFSWLGSWMMGIAYGPILPDSLLIAVPSLNEYGQLEPRFPVQFAAALTMLVFAFLLETRKIKFENEGQKAATMGMGLAVIMLLFTLLRADPAPLFMGLRLDVWAALTLLVINLIMFIWIYIRKRQPQPEK